MDHKTFNNALSGKRKPQKKTLKKIFDAFPSLMQNKYFKNILYQNKNFSADVGEWEMMIESFRTASEPYADTAFPFFQKKLLEIIKIEEKMHSEGETITEFEEMVAIFSNNDFIQKFLSDEDNQKLNNSTINKQEFEQVMVQVVCKITLYCGAYADAEYCYGFKDHEDINNQTKKLGKVSLLQVLLPEWENDKLINPVEKLFRKWKKNFKQPYSFMQQFISVSTNGDSDLLRESQKTKFKQWRRGEKVANYEEILNIIKGISPESDNIDDYSHNIIMIYHVSLFCLNFFKHLREINTRVTSLFRTDKEVVEWMHENYNKFFDEAYTDIETYYESA